MLATLGVSISLHMNYSADIDKKRNHVLSQCEPISHVYFGEMLVVGLRYSPSISSHRDNDC